MTTEAETGSRRTFVAAASLAAFGLLAGCGGGAGRDAGTAPGVSEANMADVKELVQTYSRQKKAVPGKVGDIKSMEPAFPDAVSLITRGEVVYAWGCGLAADQAVLAHPKDAATAGGWVLFQDGTTKQLTAAEFAAAKRAKK